MAKPRITIGRKLTFGFGAVVAVLVAMSVLTLTQVSGLVKGQETVINQDLPTQTLSLKLRGRIHAALSAHRGYMILGLPVLKEERSNIWESINAESAELAQLVEAQHDPDAVAMVSELRGILAEFSSAQEQIVQCAHTPENEPARLLFETQALPLGKKMQEHLEAILDSETREEATGDRKLLVDYVSRAEAHLLKVTAELTQFLSDGSDAQLAVLNQEVDACSASVARLKTKTGLFTPGQKADFDAYIAARDNFLSVAKQVIAQRNAPDWNQAEYICLNTVTPLAGQADEVIGRIIEHAESIIAAHEDDLTASSTFVQQAVLVSAVVAVVAAIVIALLLRRSICPPIIRAAKAAQQVADGDLTVTVDVKSNDECGDLAQGFNEMVGKVSNMISTVARATNEVASAATEIAATSDEMARGMEEQSSQVTQISAAVEQMSASVIEVAKKSADAAGNAQQSGKAAQEGGAVVDQTISEMRAISDAVDCSAKAVENLGKRGEQIGEIVATINDIADQTNLLALNAAIEAARAGEHGRGFAVVADEVRKLADRTTQATEEIAESITAIQTETTQAVNNMNAGSQQVNNGVTKATEAGTALTSIVTNANAVAEMIQSIAAATEEQSATSEEVARNLENITGVTAAAKQGTDQAATASMQLSHKAEELLRLVNQFKTDEKANARANNTAGSNANNQTKNNDLEDPIKQAARAFKAAA